MKLPQNSHPSDRTLMLAVSVSVFAAMVLLRVPAPVHIDTSENFGLAFSCVHGGVCPSAGHGTSFQQLSHFALFQRFLRVCVDWPIAWIQNALAVLLAAAIGGMYAMARRMGAQPLTAIVSAGLYLGFSLWFTEYPTIFNRSILPLPAVVAWTAFLSLARPTNLAVPLLAGLSLSILIESYLEALLLIPFVIGLITVSCERPFLSLLVAGVAGLAEFAVLSRDALLHNLNRLYETGLLVPALVGCATPVGLALPMRNAWAALAVRRRMFWIVGLPLFLVLTTVLAGSVYLQRTGDDVISYMTPVLPPVALLATFALNSTVARFVSSSPPRARSFIAMGVTGVWLTLVFAGLHLGNRIVLLPTFAETREVMTYAFSLGYSESELVRRIRGRSMSNLRGAVRGFAHLSRGSQAGPDQDFVWLTLPPSMAPRVPVGWRTFDLNEGHLLVASQLRSFVDLDSYQICAPARLGKDRTCLPLPSRELEFLNIKDQMELARAMGLDADLRFYVPIRTFADEPAHIIECAPRWTIVGVEGVLARNEVPTRSLVVEGRSSGMGALWVKLDPRWLERTTGAIGLPDIWDIREQDAALAGPSAWPYVDTP